ncbi:hypothetical protein C1645_781247 [Glomus cerebriforme]|uniref:Uncharacterized protein n=1 Tax=Glomus cerebriforme TaxID=658196 RepID=A0A397SJA8_9GLOM|nr:hypothetical protein C1645_781247 [Glomus cerebriforme]
MDYNNFLQNNNTHSNNLQSPQMNQPLSNALYNNVNASCSYTDYFPAVDNNIIPASNTYEQQLSFANGGHAISTTPYAPQYIGQNIFPSPLGSLVTTVNSSQINHSGVFRFEIPGFEIFIVPTYSPYTNSNDLNMQNPPQRDITSTAQSLFYAPQGVFRFEIPGFKIIIIPTSSPYVNLNNLNMQNQPQQNYVPSNIVPSNLQNQFQQNSNDAFINFNNFHG